METIFGKYNHALTFSDDPVVKDKIELLCDQSFSANSKIRILSGEQNAKHGVLGTTLTFSHLIVPSLLGRDIGCGTLTCKLKEKEIDLRYLHKTIQKVLPQGNDARTKPHPLARHFDFSTLKCTPDISKRKALLELGTLGEDCHFIEINQDEEDFLYFTIHTGSRSLGKQVSKYYRTLAEEKHSGHQRARIQNATDILKKKHSTKDIVRILNTLQTQIEAYAPQSLAFLENDDLTNYLHDIDLVQKYAALNRKIIAQEILNTLGLHSTESFTTLHNAIDTEKMILRQGACAAYAGEKSLIFLGTNKGNLICCGKSNEEWNFSAPQSVGHLYDTENAFSFNDFKTNLKDICAIPAHFEIWGKRGISYKKMAEIIRHLEPTATVLHFLKPLFLFKNNQDESL